jgi:hypothetical protein
MINQHNLRQRGKIVFTLVLALILSAVFSNTIFLANTPRINTIFLAKLKNAPGDLLNGTTVFLSSLMRPNGTALTSQEKQNIINSFNSLPVSTMKSIGTGVYAKEDKKNNTVYIKVNKDAQWEERILIIDGKQVKVRFPKGNLK